MTIYDQRRLRQFSVPGGAPFSVDQEAEPRFRRFVDDMSARGVTFDPKQSGGFADRNIRGTGTPSKHSTGQAIDVNWNTNPEGASAHQFPADVSDIAARNGLKWGGNFMRRRGPDNMHFEVDPSLTPETRSPFAGDPSGADPPMYSVPGVSPVSADPMIAAPVAPAKPPLQVASAPVTPAVRPPVTKPESPFASMLPDAASFVNSSAGTDMGKGISQGLGGLGKALGGGGDDKEKQRAIDAQMAQAGNTAQASQQGKAKAGQAALDRLMQMSGVKKKSLFGAA